MESQIEYAPRVHIRRQGVSNRRGSGLQALLYLRVALFASAFSLLLELCCQDCVAPMAMVASQSFLKDMQVNWGSIATVSHLAATFADVLFTPCLVMLPA